MIETNDLNVVGMTKLMAPRALKALYPLTDVQAATVSQARQTVGSILRGEDPRVLGVIGPCSIHDRASALEYADRLAGLQKRLGDRLYLVMRVYFEKPRTTVGWRGFLVDPRLDGSQAIEDGLKEARHLLSTLTDRGIPCATEVLDPIVPQYLADLITWAAVGARTTESQTHRDMTSGLSFPVGFKNGTDGSFEVAVNALAASREAKSFLGIDQDGQTCIVSTRGNQGGHVILRGGKSGPNYGPESLDAAEKALAAARLPGALIVDCSHANSNKKPELQPAVLEAVAAEIAGGRKSLRGFMVESHLFGGNQPVGPLAGLKYGVSVTDGCLGWDATEKALVDFHRVIGDRTEGQR
jgi:3-deoxy-7-phosphoheptulonate synthase